MDVSENRSYCITDAAVLISRTATMHASDGLADDCAVSSHGDIARNIYKPHVEETTNSTRQGSTITATQSRTDAGADCD